MSGRDLVIIDECDTLEDVLLSFVQVEISPRRIAKYHLPTPTRKTVASSWLTWIEDCISILSTPPSSIEFPTPQQIRDSKALDALRLDLRRLASPTSGIPSDNWVYDGYNNGYIIFKPITVFPYAKDYLWRHGKRFLLMSATIISTEEMCQSLGVSN